MKKRKKPDNIYKVLDLGAADDALLQIAIKELQMESISAEAELGIHKIKKEAAAELEPLKRQIKEVEKGLEAFAVHNREGIIPKGRKSIEMNHGILGFRKSTKVAVKRTTLDLLKKLGFLKGLHVKESVNKEEMKKWTKKKLALVDASLKEDDDFWYETKQADVAEHTPYVVEEVVFP